MTNSVPASRQIFSSRSWTSSRTRVVISCMRAVFSRTPATSIERSTGTSGSSISCMTTVRSRATICSRCHADSSRTSTASAATSSSIDDASPRSSSSSRSG